MSHIEGKLFDLLDNQLSHEWEIFIKPHLNGYRPHLVALHKKWGMAFFEIVDVDVSDRAFDQECRVISNFETKEKEERYSFKRLDKFNPIPNLWNLHDTVKDLYCQD